ncbi:MAG: hypothetical protein ACTHOK_14230 [Nocardioidaceae bacterium]
MYSLLNASLLGYDLVRHRRGEDIAELLLAVLALSAADVEALGATPSVTVVRREAHADPRAGLVAALREARRRVADTDFAAAADLLATAPLGSVDDLLALVRREVAEVGRDVRAATVASAADLLDEALRALHDDCGSPALDRCRQVLPQRPEDPGPWRAELDRILAAVAGMRAAERAALGGAADRLRAEGGWARAMHTATWAVHLSGRVLPAARAQLHAVRAVRAAGVDALAAAAGTWNLVSGAVQATVVRDLLDEAASARLREPLVTALGLSAPPDTC